MTKTNPFGRALLLTASMFAAATVLAEPLQRSLGLARSVSAPMTAAKTQRPISEKSIFADVTESQRLVASVPGAFDEFGRAVATDGNTLAVGAWGNDEGAADPENDPISGDGAVSVFLRTGATWAQQQRILPSGLDKYDEFGWSVALSGDTLVVGSPGEDTLIGGSESGSVYVFTRSAGVWTEQQKLLGSNVGVNSRFGYAVAVEGDTLIASAPRENVDGVSRAGSVYVFTRSGSTWTQQARLKVAGAVADDILGTSVDLSGNYAVIGAEAADTPTGADAGAAYVFLRSGVNWTFQLRLLSPAPVIGGEFGRSVAIDGGTIAVSDHARDNATGRVVVFTGATTVWPVQQTLAASGGQPVDFFGHAVALRGDVLFIGAYQADLNTNVDRGAAYSFLRTSNVWAQVDKFFASDASTTGGTERFGFGVALSPSVAVAGAPLDENGALSDAGAAYVFNRGSETTTALFANPTTMSYGQQITLTAQVTGGTPTGSVEFRNGVNVLATAPVNGSGIASSTLTLGVGSYSITARYLGDIAHVASTSPATAVTVNLAATTTALSLSAGSNPSVYGQSVSFRAAVAVTPPGVGPATGNVEFRDNGVLVATRALIAGEATFTTNTLTHNTGTAHPITATYLGNSNYGTSTIGPLNHVVNRAAPTNALTSSQNPSLSGQQVTITATITGGIPICFMDFFADDLGNADPRVLIGSNAVSGNTASVPWTPLAAGQYAITADCGSDPNQFSANASGLTQIVNLAAEIAVTKSNGVNSVEEGVPTTYTITVTNNGPENITGLRVVDDVNTVTFDDSVNETSWTCAVAGASVCSASAGVGDLALAGTPLLLDLTAGDVATITLTTRVRAGQEGPVSNTASVVIPAGWGDAVPANNTATDTDTSGLFADGFE